MDAWSSWRAELFEDIARRIARFGWSLVYVGGGPCSVPGCDGDHGSDLDDVDLPPYGYTVGLPLGFDHPELVLVGLAVEATSLVLDRVGAMVAEGARMAPGSRFEIEGVRLKVGACYPARVSQGLISVSMDYHAEVGCASVPNPLQIMWSDDEGRFPDEPGCPARVRRVQPVLGSPPRRVHHRQRPVRRRR